MGFCKKTPFEIVKAMLLFFLIFLSTAETGAFARTMKPPTSGANTVYDPNSNRPETTYGIPAQQSEHQNLDLVLVLCSETRTL
ncbi:hypothetical protein DKX38_012122 [Salix brachista]|uniref:Uncharacterized protein n=1 Tax=Salix brachista TaxID=2182728 RepID=A0A5N5LMX8_9ROSI|nr:hypothetical protein DKX38_012122 [Salix brachista]